MNPRIQFAILGCLLAAPLAEAQLLSQDSFSTYTTGLKLPGQNPTVTGYTAAWAGVAFGTAQPAVSAGSLVYSNAAYAVGGDNKVGKASDAAGIAAGNSGRTERLLTASLAATNSTTGTVYLSWLFQTGNENTATQPNTYQTLALWNGTGATDSLRDFECGIALGDFATANYGFRVDNNAPANLNVPADANVHLMVAKFVFSATALSDSVTVWIDPALGAGEPAGGVTISNKDIAFDRLVFSDYASNSAYWDEVRWGRSFANVTTDTIIPAIPAFELQPANQVAHVNDTVTLTANAPADPSPTYQWQYSSNGTTGWAQIPDATAATYQIFSAPYSSRGFYRVVATNGNGTATSSAAQLTLTYPAPTIFTQPASTAVQVGSDVTLSVSASVLGNPSYQWFKGTDSISGANTETFSLTNVQLSNAGDYHVEITDDAGLADEGSVKTTTSNTATVSVFVPWSGLVSYEPFDIAAGYTVGELPDQTPAITGYTGAWTDVDFGNAEPAVSSSSLIYSNPSYLGSTGDKISVLTDITGGEVTAANSGRVYRHLDAPLVANDSTIGVRYLSFLFQSGQETGATNYQMLELKKSSDNDFNRTFDIGLSNGGGSSGTEFNFSAAGTYTSTGVTADANVHLLVVKFNLSNTASSDNVTVWVDPALGSGEPAGGVTVSGLDLTWDRMALSDYDGNSAAWDEIRWGSTFNSVTLNANPTNNYASWIAGYPGVGGLTGFSDDADHDGLSNGLENFMGTNPGASNTGLSQIAANGNTFTFRHPQNSTPSSDVAAVYRWSTDLVTFHASGETAGGATVTITPSLNTPTAGTTSVSAAITGTHPSKFFVDLKVTRTP